MSKHGRGNQTMTDDAGYTITAISFYDTPASDNQLGAATLVVKPIGLILYAVTIIAKPHGLFCEFQRRHKIARGEIVRSVEGVPITHSICRVDSQENWCIFSRKAVAALRAEFPEKFAAAEARVANAARLAAIAAKSLTPAAIPQPVS